MIGFKEYILEVYKPNPIPYSTLYNQDRGNMDGFVNKVEQTKRPRKRRIRVWELVDYGLIRSTQSYLTTHGGGDPVFPKLELPVIFSKDGIGYILDGHHRLAKAYTNKEIIDVYWIS